VVADGEGVVVVDPPYGSGLDELSELSHPVVLAHPDGSEECRLTDRPTPATSKSACSRPGAPIARTRSPR
jgi:tRNA (Thr-GGU) A37 N-methylase